MTEQERATKIWREGYGIGFIMGIAAVVFAGATIALLLAMIGT